MFKIIPETLYPKIKNYMSSKDRKHSDTIIGAVTLSALGVTALLGGIAAGKQYTKLAVGITLGGVAGTVLYGLLQLSLAKK